MGSRSFDAGRRAHGHALFHSMTALAALAVAPLTTACGASGWQADTELLAPPRRVAAALGDPLRPEEEAIDPTGIPVFDPPKHVRPCCQLGMDQRVKLAGVEIPGYQRGNVLSPDDLGQHAYDGGPVPLTVDDRGVGTEKNGIVYTCRGGFIDVTHVRDNADWTFFLALRLARSLPEGTTVEVPGDGAMRRVVVRKVPGEVLAERGRLAVAATLAQWAAHRLGVWHEIASWYGVESFDGFSEKGSTFSPEDLYSNALGIKIGAALAAERIPLTREDYNIAVDAWLAAVLARLDAVPRPVGRSAVDGVDGLWWDSKKFLPDPTMVMRRKLDIGARQAPWRVGDALPPGEIPGPVKLRCGKAGPPLTLTIPETIGGVPIGDVATVEIEPGEWAAKVGFPYPRAGERTLTSSDFQAVVDSMRKDMRQVLGEGFDRPARGAAGAGAPPGRGP